MQSNSFTEEDVQKYVEALNFIAAQARFGEGTPKIQFMIEARNHFAHLQSILPKIKDHILEVKSVKEIDKKAKTKGK